MRIKLTVEYDGTNFCGWQTQPGLRTVQSELENALAKLSGESVRITASGRTDAGVHAVGQVVHFDVNKDMGRKFVSGLNFFLPPDVSVRSAERVSDDFHARFSAKQKTYVYLMYESETDSPLLRCRAARTGKLDVAHMNEAAKLFLGKNDFASFRSAGSDAATTVRTVTRSEVERRGGFVTFTVTADGFLYNMVRKMAAALIETGSGRSDASKIAAYLKGEPFTLVAPPQGLYLLKVDYDQT